ncbi:hypothetical protein FLA_4049 [Filimonas lacunae]|nr:hypothetical protein FLA_4049 [Filimonas lacunae]
MASAAVPVLAQDPGFTQYFSSPQTVNPAFTGFFYGKARVITNYRRQWWGAGEPFTTASLAFDLKGKSLTYNDFDYWAIGGSALNDKSAGGLLKSNYFSLSAAYHKALDEDGFQTIAAGFQATSASRRLDIANATFESQFTSGGFNLNLPNGESYIQGNSSYMDVSAGLLYKYDDEESSYYAGASVYHATQPKESILNNKTNKVPTRMAFEVGASLPVGYNSKVFLSGLFQQQAGVLAYSAGGAYSFGLPTENADASLYLGGWYSNANISPYIGLQYNSFQLGVTYDMVTTSMKSAVKKNGSFELSLIYIFFGNDSDEGRKVVPQF